ncbi:efflux RND transporter periplasmic adaptor subunit [Fulvivirgaceae bacterium BMA10]|uniref:Efflux RND transporter periplasmic adaptor subunit n=1 Tax=Splendidivirga corallicola TaxID=3051826 RepID=A0ABT8KRD2_9BACT|nr:efflux RND transporter periplasmic adaptor subunit [Fulvivirgaceae bacterium BMA10]
MKSIKLFGIATMLLFLACSEGQVEEADTKGLEIAVKVLEVAPQKVELNKTYFGKVKYGRQMAYVAEMSGRVNALKLVPGQRVRKGQKLISFPPADHHLQVAQLQLAYDELKTNYEKQKVLNEKGAVTKHAVDELKTQLNIQEKALDQLKRVNMVTAPFNGVITEVFVTEGEEVVPGATVFSMAKPNGVQVEFFVHPKDISKVKLGSIVTMRTTEGNEVTGKVVQKAIQMSESRRAFRILAAFSEERSVVMAGQTVEVSVLHETLEEAILIPEESVKSQGNKGFVYLAQKDIAMKVEVMLGKRVGLNILVEKGIQANDLLIVGGIEKLAEGTPIKIID